ncbi:hypothetical protein J2T13_000997 [Paenibacillus sp. DS2015]|uniref:hypothetical protein n=1 Tax=Paenibacillus sp. DS2015 TaxID=3373917 RepID=UPI003D1EBADD
MSYRPIISNMTEASSNEKDGLYEFIVKMVDGTECRTFYTRNPEWKMTNINRLQKTPCPVCRKDFICKCMNSFEGVIQQQIDDNDWLDKAIAK